MNNSADKMNKTIEQLRESLLGIRSGQISPSLVDQVKMSYHGQTMPIKHLANTGVSKGGIDVIPYDSSLVGQIANVLKAAGFNAHVFSKTTVAVTVEPPSGDQKQEVIAHVKKLGEEAKIAIRNIRKHEKQHLESEELSEDEKRKSLDQLQKETDEAIKIIDDIVCHKVKQL